MNKKFIKSLFAFMLSFIMILSAVGLTPIAATANNAITANSQTVWAPVGSVIDFENFTPSQAGNLFGSSGVIFTQAFAGQTVLNANPLANHNTANWGNTHANWALPLDSGAWNIGTNDMVRIEFDLWTEWNRQHVLGWEARLNSDDGSTPVAGTIFGVRPTSNTSHPAGANQNTHLRFITSESPGGNNRNNAPTTILRNNVPRHTLSRVVMEVNLVTQVGSLVVNDAGGNEVARQNNIMMPTDQLRSFSFGAIRDGGNTWAYWDAIAHGVNTTYGAKINNIAVFGAVYDGERPTVYPASVAISGASVRNLEFGPGADAVLLTTEATATVLPLNATDRDVTWSIVPTPTPGGQGNPIVVSPVIDGNDITLTAVGAGSARVIATANLHPDGSQPLSAEFLVNVTHEIGITEPMPNFYTLFPRLGAGDFTYWQTPQWGGANMTEGFAGSNFPINNFWGFAGSATGATRRVSVHETLPGGQSNYFMEFIVDNQSGGRSTSRAFPGELRGSRVFVTFDYRPGNVNTGSGVNRPAMNLEFLYGADPLLSISHWWTPGGARQFGAFAGPVGGHDMSVATNYTPLTGIQSRANWWSTWYTFGIIFDFDSQNARIMATVRGTDDVILDVNVPFDGTSLSALSIVGLRPPTVNLVFNGNGFDNLFFFYMTHLEDTIVEVVPPEFLGRPVTPENPSPRLNIWQNWFMQVDTGATVADLDLPTTIDVITAAGDTVTTGVSWVVTEMPWTRIADIPENKVFDSSLPGVFEFSGILEDAEGYAYNRMDITPQILVEVRSGLLHEYPRPIEWLDRGVVAVPVQGGGGNLVQWRLLVTEYSDVNPLMFNIYRNDTRIASDLIATNFVDADGSVGDEYTVVPTGSGVNDAGSGTGIALASNFLEIPLQRPTIRPNPALQFGGTLNYPSVANPQRYIWYTSNDITVADIDGDGQYEILVRWQPNMQRDPGLLNPTRHTGETILDLYTLEGELIWRINLGINITTSEHHSVMHFFDLDNDGNAEFAIKTAEGTRVYHPDPVTGLVLETFEGGTPVYIIGGDGENNFAGDFNYDGVLDRSRGFYQGTWTSNPYNVWIGGTTCPVRGATNTGAVGRINNGPEFFTVFDGQTGLPIDTVEYFAPYGIRRGAWGDTAQNRSDRFNGAVAFMPRAGVSGAEPWPTVIEVRQHYGPHHVAAYQLIDGQIQMIWDFDFRDWGTGHNQGNHQMSVADTTRNGYDDVLFGSVVLDYRGHVLWSATSSRGTLYAVHGDALHMSVIFPDSDEFYRFSPHEAGPPNNVTLFNAATGRPHMTYDAPDDVGRGTMGNITPLPGFEFWASGTAVVNSYTGERIRIAAGIDEGGMGYGGGFVPANHMVYWSGTLRRDFLDGNSGQPLTVSRLGNFNFTQQDFLDNTLPNELVATRQNVQTFGGTSSNNGTKANPGLQADILGDWRENVIVRVADGVTPGAHNPTRDAAIRVYISNIPTNYTMYTFMHDATYRAAVSWQNSVYNQPPHLGFYLGDAVRDDVLARTLPTPYTRFTAEPVSTTEFDGTSPNALGRLLEDYNVVLSTRGNLGIFANHSPFVIPAGRTLTVTTTLNISGNAELIVEGTLIVAEGGRINNQGSAGGTIRVAAGGNLVNNGWVENVTNSTFANNGTITNNGRFEVRGGVTFYDQGTVTGTPLNINRNATVIS
ncbi:MAG: hypothetical protein FWD05_02115 [Oscillospiraceae bacterium]|nr:hypothetical protein [Oscillospiraceae bacterium]